MVAWPGKQDREGKNVVENSWVRIRTFWLQKAEGQQCMESSLDRGERGKDAQGSTVPSDVWSAKSNRGQTSDHLRPSMARGMDLPCPMLWDTSRVSGLEGPYVNGMMENSNPKRRVQPPRPASSAETSRVPHTLKYCTDTGPDSSRSFTDDLSQVGDVDHEGKMNFQ